MKHSTGNFRRNDILRLFLICALILATLAACSGRDPAPTTTPTALPSPIPGEVTLIPTFPPPATWTPIPSLTPSPTSTPSPTPTFTPTALVYAEEGTPLPLTLQVITYQNAMLVSQLAEWQEENVSDLTWAPDNRTLAIASYANVSIYDVPTRSRQDIIQTYPGVSSIDFSPSGQYLATGYTFGSEGEGLSGGVDFWRAPTWEQIQILYSDTQGVSEVSFASFGSTFAAAFSSHIYEDNDVFVWSVYSLQITQTLQTGTVQGIAFSPNGGVFASTPDRYSINLWQTFDGKKLRETYTSFTGAVNSLAISPNGSMLATGHYDGQIHLWDMEKGTLLFTMVPGGVVQSLSFSPDSTVLASGDSFDTNAVFLWDTTSGQRLNVLMGHPKGVQALEFSPNGQILASASYDGSVRLWGIRP